MTDDGDAFLVLRTLAVLADARRRRRSDAQQREEEEEERYHASHGLPVCALLDWTGLD